MITKETVLILGAGASAPYGFPSGQRLKDLVCHGSDHEVGRAGIDVLVYSSLKSTLLRSGCSSVDSFLESRPEYLDIGKTAIAATLLPMERTGKLFDEWSAIRLKPNISKDYLNNWPWYEFLFGILADGIPFEDIGGNKLSVVTFNYDRSLEHFLFTALKNRYGKTDGDCAELIDHHLPIVHVYGSLGKLEWQEGANEANTVPYVSRGEAPYLQLAANNIVILHEGVGNSPEFTEARKLLNSAEQVFFVGFGYHPVNLQRLGIGKEIILPKTTVGTALSLDKGRRQHFKSLTEVFRGGHRDSRRQVLIDVDAYTLLHDHVTFN